MAGGIGGNLPYTGILKSPYGAVGPEMTPKKKTGYTAWGAPVEVDDSTALTRWAPGMSGGTYDAPPPAEPERHASESVLAPAPSPQHQSPSVAAPAPSASTPLQEAYRGYLAQPAQTAAAPSTPAMDLAPVTSLIQQLTERGAKDQERQQAERAAMRDLLMSRIGQASQPVDVETPGIKQTLAAQRLARQRSAERQRSQSATRLASEGLSDSGAAETAQIGIEQMRGEGEAGDIAATLLPEHQAKRQELQNLLAMAVSQGESEAARSLQAQIQALDATMGVMSLQQRGQQADEEARFRRSAFLDNFNLQRALAGQRA